MGWDVWAAVRMLDSHEICGLVTIVCTVYGVVVGGRLSSVVYPRYPARSPV